MSLSKQYRETAFLGETFPGIERFPEKAVPVVSGVNQAFNGLLSKQNSVLDSTNP